jgi:hypothetical protein
MVAAACLGEQNLPAEGALISHIFLRELSSVGLQLAWEKCQQVTGVLGPNFLYGLLEAESCSTAGFLGEQRLPAAGFLGPITHTGFRALSSVVMLLG